MSIGDDTHVYRRHLPHLTKEGKRYFVTFRTRSHFVLPDPARDAVLRVAVQLHEVFCWVDCVTIMPDHVHAILAPYENGFSDVMKRLKGGSAYEANRVMGRTGPLWQHESFDHILRSDESLAQKMDYICGNPVRAMLVKRWQDYLWTWRACDRRPAEAGPHTTS